MICKLVYISVDKDCGSTERVIYGSFSDIKHVFFQTTSMEVPSIFGERLLKVVMYVQHDIPQHAWVITKGSVLYNRKYTINDSIVVNPTIEDINEVLAIPESVFSDKSIFTE